MRAHKAMKRFSSEVAIDCWDCENASNSSSGALKMQEWKRREL